MWDHIINIHPSELLSTKTKKFRISESLKKKKCFIIIKKNMDNLYFIPINIFTKFFKELVKYKNDYQQYLNFIYIYIYNNNYIVHLIVYLYVYPCICIELQASVY